MHNTLSFELLRSLAFGNFEKVKAQVEAELLKPNVDAEAILLILQEANNDERHRRHHAN